jgi:hypothetical protein
MTVSSQATCRLLTRTVGEGVGFSVDLSVAAGGRISQALLLLAAGHGTRALGSSQRSATAQSARRDDRSPRCNEWQEGQCGSSWLVGERMPVNKCRLEPVRLLPFAATAG